MSLTAKFANMGGGAGGGTTLIRATGMLQANTTPEVFPTPPPVLTVSFSNADPETFTVSIELDSFSNTVAFGSTDPGGVDAFIDSSSFASPVDYSGALHSALSGMGVASSDLGGIVEIYNMNTGFGSALFGSTAGSGNVGIGGGGGGSDGAPASGATLTAPLISGVGGKRIKIVAAWIEGNIGGGVIVYLFDPDGDLSVRTQANTSGALNPAQGALDNWVNGGPASGGLSAAIEEGSMPEDGSTCTVSVIAEQY